MKNTPAALPTFDIVDAASFGYQLVWAERQYLIRLATVPILISIVCHMAIAALGWEFYFLRQAIVMLPSYFAEGWMVCHLVRLVFLGQRWPFIPSGDAVRDEAALDDRAYGIFAGTLVYVLIKLASAGVLMLASSARLSEEPAPVLAAGENPPAELLLIQMALIIMGIWVFRFLWVHVGVAAGYRVRTYINAVRGFGVSVQMLGVALLCTFPLFVVLLFVTMGMFADYHRQSIPVPMSLQFIATVISSVAATIITLINTAAITQGFGRLLDLYFRKN